MVEEYDSECEICKVFSSSARLKILVSLEKKSLGVNEIAEKTGLPQSVVSQHLSMMKLREILKAEKRGNFIYYSIEYPEILDAFDIIKKIRRKMR